MLNIGKSMSGFNGMQNPQAPSKGATPSNRMPEQTSNNRNYRYPAQFDDYYSEVTLPQTNLKDAGYNMVNVGQRFNAPQFNALHNPGNNMSLPQLKTPGAREANLPSTKGNLNLPAQYGPQQTDLSTAGYNMVNIGKRFDAPQFNAMNNPGDIAKVPSLQGSIPSNTNFGGQNTRPIPSVVAPNNPAPQSKAPVSGSIVDYLVSKGMDHSLTNRKRLYEQMFGQEYDMTNTAASNLRLLQALQNGNQAQGGMQRMQTNVPQVAVSGVNPTKLPSLSAGTPQLAMNKRRF